MTIWGEIFMKERNVKIFAIFLTVSAVLLLTRFAAGFVYKPVMDDWFLYGDLYGDVINDFALPNAKFTIRPLAGILDIFLAAPLFNHLWIVELIMTLLLAAGAAIFYDVLSDNGFAPSGLFLISLCFVPMNMEATYWLAASIRISCALFFTALTLRLLNNYLKSDKKIYAVLYAVSGFFAVSFYEPAIVIYVMLFAYLLYRKRGRKYTYLIFIIAAHLTYIALYYILNSGSGEMTVRGHLFSSNFFSQARAVTDMVGRVLVLYDWRAFVRGLKCGAELILSRGLYVQTAALLALSVFLGILVRHEGKDRRFSMKRLLISLALTVGGVAVFYVIGFLYTAIRFVYFSFIGIGLAACELALLTPQKIQPVLRCTVTAALTFVFAVSGMGITSQYIKTSEEDVRIVNEILALDTENFAVNPDRNTYLLGAKPYYDDVGSVGWLESIRGACSGYADITGCMRHLTGVTNTNNLTPVRDGEAISMTYYINSPEICRFFALDETAHVISVSVHETDGGYEVTEEGGERYGIIADDEDGAYRFYRKLIG